MDRWPCWSYFNHVLDAPVWGDVRILDFGGNWGNFLRDPQCAVRPEQYWCLDIDHHAVELGRRDFPTGNWHHYNRWNQRYNPSGNHDEPVPDMQTQFDVIIAYSVFTHTSRREMVETVREELVPRLTSNGRCVLTLLTPDRLPHFLTRYSQLEHERVSAVVAQARNLRSGFYLFGRDNLVSVNAELPQRPDRLSLTSFYLPEEMTSLWPDFRVRLRLDTGDFQAAVIIQKGTR
jgi:hypothetical protein